MEEEDFSALSSSESESEYQRITVAGQNIFEPESVSESENEEDYHPRIGNVPAILARLKSVPVKEVGTSQVSKEGTGVEGNKLTPEVARIESVPKIEVADTEEREVEAKGGRLEGTVKTEVEENEDGLGGLGVPPPDLEDDDTSDTTVFMPPAQRKTERENISEGEAVEEEDRMAPSPPDIYYEPETPSPVPPVESEEENEAGDRSPSRSSRISVDSAISGESIEDEEIIDPEKVREREELGFKSRLVNNLGYLADVVMELTKRLTLMEDFIHFEHESEFRIFAKERTQLIDLGFDDRDLLDITKRPEAYKDGSELLDLLTTIKYGRGPCYFLNNKETEEGIRLTSLKRFTRTQFRYICQNSEAQEQAIAPRPNPPCQNHLSRRQRQRLLKAGQNPNFIPMQGPGRNNWPSDPRKRPPPNNPQNNKMGKMDFNFQPRPGPYPQTPPATFFNLPRTVSVSPSPFCNPLQQQQTTGVPPTQLEFRAPQAHNLNQSGPPGPAPGGWMPPSSSQADIQIPSSSPTQHSTQQQQPQQFNPQLSHPGPPTHSLPQQQQHPASNPLLPQPNQSNMSQPRTPWLPPSPHPQRNPFPMFMQPEQHPFLNQQQFNPFLNPFFANQVNFTPATLSSNQLTPHPPLIFPNENTAQPLQCPQQQTNPCPTVQMEPPPANKNPFEIAPQPPPVTEQPFPPLPPVPPAIQDKPPPPPPQSPPLPPTARKDSVGRDPPEVVDLSPVSPEQKDPVQEKPKRIRIRGRKRNQNQQFTSTNFHDMRKKILLEALKYSFGDLTGSSAASSTGNPQPSISTAVPSASATFEEPYLESVSPEPNIPGVTADSNEVMK